MFKTREAAGSVAALNPTSPVSRGSAEQLISPEAKTQLYEEANQRKEGKKRGERSEWRCPWADLPWEEQTDRTELGHPSPSPEPRGSITLALPSQRG